MENITIVHGDLMKAVETYICHQCNCVTNRSAHLAKTVFKHFPHADVYTKRQEPDQPGTIELRGEPDKDQRYVVAMFAQYYPGKTKYPNSKKDGLGARLSYFKSCLDKMKDLKGSFAFPYKIGCGAAGGSWDDYFQCIKEFSSEHNKKVVIYNIEPEPKKEARELF